MTVTLWSRDGLHVDVHLRADGALQFFGHDLAPRIPGVDEYEYWVTVSPVDVPRVVAALDGQPGDDVLVLLEANAEAIVKTGEKTWVTSLGIEPEFSSWMH